MGNIENPNNHKMPKKFDNLEIKKNQEEGDSLNEKYTGKNQDKKNLNKPEDIQNLRREIKKKRAEVAGENGDLEEADIKGLKDFLGTIDSYEDKIKDNERHDSLQNFINDFRDYLQGLREEVKDQIEQKEIENDQEDIQNLRKGR